MYFGALPPNVNVGCQPDSQIWVDIKLGGSLSPIGTLKLHFREVC